jgi:hypothetical protein
MPLITLEFKPRAEINPLVLLDFLSFVRHLEFAPPLMNKRQCDLSFDADNSYAEFDLRIACYQHPMMSFQTYLRCTRTDHFRNDQRMRYDKIQFLDHFNLIKTSGGPDRDRTDDLLNANQALSQLSYGPTKKVVGLARLELATPRLSSVCSNQLSYKPPH